MKLPKLPKWKNSRLKKQLADKDKTISRLLVELQEKTSRIEKLQGFSSVVMRHIGRLEGQAKLTDQITLTHEESGDVIRAAEIYQCTLQP